MADDRFVAGAWRLRTRTAGWIREFPDVVSFNALMSRTFMSGAAPSRAADEDRARECRRWSDGHPSEPFLGLRETWRFLSARVLLLPRRA